MASARDLFARMGPEVQMEEIAAHSGLGVGTLYRHFPNKEALLIAIVRERWLVMSEVARAAEAIDDPAEALETVLRSYLEAVDGDAGFQFAMLGSKQLEWEDAEREKSEFSDSVRRIIDRAVSAGAVREDLTFDDFPMLTTGVMATMYFKPGKNPDWRRHLELLLRGTLS